MASFTDVLSNTLAKASDVQQILDALKGTIGKGIPLSPTAVNDAIAFALSVKNLDATNSRAGAFYKADGSVLLQIDKNGVQASPDGSAAAAPVATTTTAQTLTNKTLTSPVITTPTGDVLTRIATAGPLTSPAATIDFTAIPATYRNLLLVIQGRGDAAVVTASVFLRLNNDATTNYNRHYVTAAGTTAPSTVESVGTASVYVGECPAASASAAYAGLIIVRIPNYVGATLNKNITFEASSAAPTVAGTSQWQRGGGNWAGSGAVNRITVLPPSGAGNWVTGSVATLYGEP